MTGVRTQPVPSSGVPKTAAGVGRGVGVQRRSTIGYGDSTQQRSSGLLDAPPKSSANTAQASLNGSTDLDEYASI